MKKEVTKEQVRIALCYLVGWLTENSVHRVVKCMRDICSELPENDQYAGMVVLRAMEKKGWARYQCHSYYIASCTTPKLKDDESVTAAVEEIWPMIADIKVKVRGKAEPKDEAIQKEDMGDLMPEGVTEKVCENTPKVCEKVCTDDTEDFLNRVGGLALSNPQILVKELRSAGWEVTCRKTIIQEL